MLIGNMITQNTRLGKHLGGGNYKEVDVEAFLRIACKIGNAAITALAL